MCSHNTNSLASIFIAPVLPPPFPSPIWQRLLDNWSEMLPLSLDESFPAAALNADEAAPVSPEASALIVLLFFGCSKQKVAQRRCDNGKI